MEVDHMRGVAMAMVAFPRPTPISGRPSSSRSGSCSSSWSSAWPPRLSGVRTRGAGTAGTGAREWTNGTAS